MATLLAQSGLFEGVVLGVLNAQDSAGALDATYEVLLGHVNSNPHDPARIIT